MDTTTCRTSPAHRAWAEQKRREHARELIDVMVGQYRNAAYRDLRAALRRSILELSWRYHLTPPAELME